MNKSELIDAMASTAELTKADTAKALDAFVKVVTKSLQDGDQVTIVGFGSFLARHRDERVGRNPRTGENITIPAAQIPSFKAGKALKDALN